MVVRLQSLLSQKSLDKLLKEYTYNPIEDNRQKMVDRYKDKYGEKDTSIRVASRRNINYTMKLVITSIVAHLITNAPFKTGNLKLNGIRYKTSKNLGIISIGSPSAPYGVHLNFQKNIHSGWIDDALTMAMADITSNTPKNAISIQLRDILEYGYWQIRVEIY